MTFIPLVISMASFLFVNTVFADNISFTTPLSGSTNFGIPDSTTYTMPCPDGFTLERVGMVLSQSTAGDMDLLVNSSSVGTVTVNSSDLWRYWNNVDTECDGTDLELQLDNADGSYNIYNTGYSGFSIEGVPISYIQSDLTSNYQMMFAEFSITPISPTTVHIPYDSTLSSTECISESPTTTCSFNYSTSTASTTYDYLNEKFNPFFILLVIIFLLSSLFGIFTIAIRIFYK